MWCVECTNCIVFIFEYSFGCIAHRILYIVWCNVRVCVHVCVYKSAEMFRFWIQRKWRSCHTPKKKFIRIDFFPLTFHSLCLPFRVVLPPTMWRCCQSILIFIYLLEMLFFSLSFILCLIHYYDGRRERSNLKSNFNFSMYSGRTGNSLFVY